MPLSLAASAVQLLVVWSILTGLQRAAGSTTSNNGGSTTVAGFTSPCHVCTRDATFLRNRTTPRPWTESMLRPQPNFLRGNDDDDIDGNRTCGDWQTIANNHTKTSTQCMDLVDYLELQCCDLNGTVFPPVYKCESAARQALLGPAAEYEQEIAPFIGGGTPLEVGVQMEVYNVEVVDHGVNGGAVAFTGKLHLEWVDERFRFQNISDQMGCTSFLVKRKSIWAPGLKGDEDLVNSGRGQLANLPEDTQVAVLADGRVFDSFWGHTTLLCHTEPGASKECILKWQDTTGNRNVKYTPRGANGGVFVHNLQSMPPPGYNFNRTATALTVTPDAELGHEIQRVQLTLRFDPKETDCNVCGDDQNTTLIPDEIPADNRQWHGGDHKDHVGWNCRELDNFLINLTVGSENCALGRAFFEEPCCHDIRPNFKCESNIHEVLTREKNTITPPDPSPREVNSSVLSEEDYVDVRVSLDIVHVMGIDVKSNTMELLVGLELDWYDSRLSWEPFLGGCHRASFRASLDAELTEIWVPNLELVNMREGVNSLPDATASVLYNGKVIWRRLGILSATCDLDGIKKFPFDMSECALEFGGTRSPLFHRVKYNYKKAEYSEDVRNEREFSKEYKLKYTLTEMLKKNESLTGFSNEIMTYTFFFNRAVKYYVYNFIVLYIIFTTLSFGMFFVDYRLGERLGYGSAMLFVIVAQDITLGDFTPVTSRVLWMNKLSLGSKCFVVLGIIQSIFIIYIFNFDDEEDTKPTAGGVGIIETPPCLEIRESPCEKRAMGSSRELEEGLDGYPKTKASSRSDENSVDNNDESQDAPVPGVSEQTQTSLRKRTSSLHHQLEEGFGDDPKAKVRTRSNQKLMDEDDACLHAPDPCVPKLTRMSLKKRKPSLYKMVFRIIVGKHNIPRSVDSMRDKKRKKLLVYDRITALIFFMAYFIFVLVLYLECL